MDLLKNTAFIHDKKTGKGIHYIKPVVRFASIFRDYVQENINSDWLFPSTTHTDRHIK